MKDMLSKGNVVFFGGAGVSTESGVPDFRSAGGIFAKKCDIPPERCPVLVKRTELERQRRERDEKRQKTEVQ